MFPLSTRGRKGDFGLYLRGAFDPEALPEEWKLDERAPMVRHEPIRRTAGGFWVAQNPFTELRAS